MSAKPYKAKSLAGAEREVRRLRKQSAYFMDLFEREYKNANLMAKLAADGPAFYNPLEVYEAKKFRNEILKQRCRLKPDGSPIERRTP